MSRTNKPRHRGEHGYVANYLSWGKRFGNKTDRAWARQNVCAMNVSVFDQLLEDIAADQLEERGAFTLAMKLRDLQEPLLPAKRSDRWRGWW